jgi:hypothetical protein
VAEPPVIVMRETHRRRLCKAPSQKATLGDLAGYRSFYKANSVRRPASLRVGGRTTASVFMATPLLRSVFVVGARGSGASDSDEAELYPI